jgi:hypothetical protein
MGHPQHQTNAGQQRDPRHFLVNGNVLSSGPSVTLNQGQTPFFELNGNTLVNGFGQRVQVRPLITTSSADGTCSASTETYEQLTGRTLVYGQRGEHAVKGNLRAGAGSCSSLRL